MHSTNTNNNPVLKILAVYAAALGLGKFVLSLYNSFPSHWSNISSIQSYNQNGVAL